MSARPTRASLQQLYERVERLRISVSDRDQYDTGYNAAISNALAEIRVVVNALEVVQQKRRETIQRRYGRTIRTQ